MATTTITKDNLESTIEAGGIVILDFWAEWCGPCRGFAPTFEAASEQHPDIVFGKIDTEAEPEIAASAQIQAIPTLMAFKDGIAVFRESGALPPAAFEDLIGQLKGLDMDEIRKQIAEQQSQAKQ